MENFKKWHRAELLLFTLATILNLLPFVATRFFPSMDGASHLSNSNIINQLVFHNNSLFQQFFMINPEPVPNWTSHLLISLLTLIMPAFLGEKILVAFLLAATPFAFRSLMQTISPKQFLLSYLVFPFTHSMFFFFGFFNFCMAVLLFLLTLRYWLRHSSNPLKLRQAIILFLLVAITYFSHIVIFGILLITVAMHIVSQAARELALREDPMDVLVRFMRKTFAITAAAIVPLLLFAYFFYSRPGTREVTYIAPQDLFNYLVTVRPLISLNPIIEGKQTVILFYTLFALVVAWIVAALIRTFRQPGSAFKIKPTGSLHAIKGYGSWWLPSSMVVLMVLYFTLPDAYGTASYTNLRIAFVFFLLTILWISTLRIPWYFGLIAAITGLYVNTMLIRYYKPNIDELGSLAVSCNKAADHLAPNSLVLPIYCLDNWFTGHFVDYLAVDKPVVMVYNYECESGYFPVIWNKELKPDYYLGNPETPEKYVKFGLTGNRSPVRLDYVFILGTLDPQKDWFFGTLDKILAEDFKLVYESGSCHLYQNKLTLFR